MDEHQRIFKLASIMLQHPELEWIESEDLSEEIELIDNKLVKILLKQFYEHLQTIPYYELSKTYAETFDFSDKTTLYLTYLIFGDNPDRGKGLLKLKQEFLEAGFPLESDELPDYLPLILEFCSIAPIEVIQKVLMIHRKAIDQLLKELALMNSPYQTVLQACIQEIENLISKQKAS